MNLRIPPAAFLAVTLLSTSALGETPASAPPAWSYRFDATFNVLPDQQDYLQPTLTADRGPLHLEGRYNYEDQESVAGFVGWNHEMGATVHLALVPMFGGVTGKTDGVIPALEFTLDWKQIELYSEDEYVINLDQSSDSFYYHWSELVFSPANWVAAGLVIQRSRVIHSSRDTQLGPMARFTKGPLEAAAYFLNPASDDHYFIGSLAVSF